MKTPNVASVPSPAPAQIKTFAVAAGALTAAFSLPLARLFRFAFGDDLHSYILLMPFVAGYLAWQRWKEHAAADGPDQHAALVSATLPSRLPAFVFGLAGAAALAGYFLFASPVVENRLVLSTLAWVLLITGAGCWFLGRAAMRALVFPFFLLIFMVPLPVGVRDGIEAALQHGSAVVADWMFTLAGMPFWRDDMVFRMPGITLEVAPECSGIHSTWVLFITSLIAGHMILRQPWRRAALCLAVIPLALARNGFRILVIGELCVHRGPQMINSPIHRHGGPLFFALSLVPFFLLLYLLKKSETRGAAGKASK